MTVPSLDPLHVPLLGTTLIEASAGTGKTHTITTLYLRLLLERQLAVENILVVTFTRAATAELSERIRKRIAALLDCLSARPQSQHDPELEALAALRPAEEREKDQVRLQAALYSFDQAAISTIHAFCLRMLQQHAFEGGLPFDVELSPDAERLVDELLDTFWIRLVHDPRHTEQVEALFAADSKAGLDARRARKRLRELVHCRFRHPEIEVLWDERGGNDMAAWWSRIGQECLDFVFGELERRASQRRKLSFNDVLQRFRAALQRGSELAATVRQQFPAALVDEFQDTDPVQYDIFRTLYLGQPDCSLFVIGDPKQSIYAFRGADVFAYLRAKRDAEQVLCLNRNWRSWPAMVQAVNALFGRTPEPFLIPDIQFQPAEPALSQHAPEAGLEILFVPSQRPNDGRSERKVTKGEALPLVAEIVAREIQRFVHEHPKIGGEEVDCSSIAVLCNTNEQARKMQEALRALHIPSVIETEASVFDSEEARELEWVLAAVADPTNASLLRRALTTSLFTVGAQELLSYIEDRTGTEDPWERQLERFFRWREVWERHGVAAGVREILEENDTLTRWLSLTDGERRATNLFHLTELLHRASVEQELSPLALIDWLATMRRNEEARSAEAGYGEQAQLRLESDEPAVKLVTIHKSKGLQYPIVYCPFLWAESVRRTNEQPVFHRESDYGLQLDARLPTPSDSLRQATWEERAEARRRLYVALTRARIRCTVVWGNFNEAQHSPIAGLLHPRAIEEQPRTGRPSWRKEWIARGDHALLADLEELSAAADGTIHLNVWDGTTAHSRQPTQWGTEPPAPLHAREAVRAFTPSWRVASFSSLVAEHDATRPFFAEGADFDVLAAPGRAERDAPPPSALLFRTFPPGKGTGEILHRIFEKLDFTQPVHQQRPILETELASSPFGELEDLERSLQQVLATPLPTGFHLGDLPRERCLHELDFLLPVRTAKGHDPGIGNGAEDLMGAGELKQVFLEHSDLPNAREYAEELGELPFSAWQGFLKGYIDLVFEHGGQWYLADYKSNDLGPDPADYAPQRLLPVMARHHYLLQYHLYVVALHRFLRQRLPEYDYDTHVAGVLYFFLRAISPQHPPGSGVFFHRPSKAMVHALDELFEAKEKR